MPRVLISVSDKTDVIKLAQGLNELGWDIVASGGTARAIRESESGVVVLSVENVTGAPEMLGGRVKTLHPAIHAGILARDTDFQELTDLGYTPIDMVICNLYPFQKAIGKPDITQEEAIEHIDIGGVTLLRAAAKNFQRVTVIVDPEDYDVVLNQLKSSGQISPELRRQLAIKAFAHIRDYDTAIYAYLMRDWKTSGDTLKEAFSLAVVQAQELRYGENPHQQAGFFAESATKAPLGELLGGKPLSYNNILDTDAAWGAVNAFDPAEEAAVVIVKHLNPTGIAVGVSLESAFPFALDSDPVSAFGGVIAVNHPVTDAFVKALGSLFVEVIIAPGFEQSAVETLLAKRKNCRLIRADLSQTTAASQIEFRSVYGGVLVQQVDNGDPKSAEWRIVTKRQPSDVELATLKFAWKATQHVKSNAIVLAHQGATVGIGGGLPSRVDAVKLAVQKAGKNTSGAVMASDAFFPFPDGIEEAAKAGVTAVVQPGGSLRDQQVINTADELGMAMIFTGIRHFRH